MGSTQEKRTRDPERTRNNILKVAFAEIFRRGYQGVSINDIIAKTDLTKGAFFHHFPTKQSLGYALVDEVLHKMVLERWILPLEKYENPIGGIAEVLKNIIDRTPEESISLGCPLNNLIQEMSPVDPVFRDKLRAVLQLWIDGVEAHLKTARQRGFLKQEVNPKLLAEFIVMNHEGAFGMTKALRDRQVLRSLHASLVRYLNTVSSSPIRAKPTL